MDSEEFTNIFVRQQGMCADVLLNKAREYATEDRLHNFKTAAVLEGITTRQALAGMMAKHTVSIYDMCHSEELYDSDAWDEKITDHMNYLILLKAIVVDEEKSASHDAMFPNI